MNTEIVINVNPLEKRIAILENNKLVELFVEKEEGKNIVGNIYKGKVQNVLPGMGACFVDIAEDRTAFLHYSDISTEFLEELDSDKSTLTQIDSDSSNIDEYLKPGQEIIVQVQKGPIGKKGARLRGQISIPGKFLVFIPHSHKIAVSRKINNYKEKKRIKKTLNSVKDPNVGLIVRTDAQGNTEEEFTQEYNGLYKTWKLIEKQIKYAKAPTCIFKENDLINTLIRDLFSSKVDKLVVDNKKFKNHIVNQLKDVSPDLCKRIELFQEDSPIFDAYGIEKEIQKIFNSKIGLPSGGSIVIEQTEALVAVDVNTGSFTGNKNYEHTVKKTNLEAAHEVVRQIRLRDLSGIVVVDFIDMRVEAHKDAVVRTLKQEFKRDRAKSKVFPFSPLGLVEITRKKTKPSVVKRFSEKCPYCRGSGRILSKNSTVTKIFRWIQRLQFFIGKKEIKIFVHPKIKLLMKENSDYFKKLHKKIQIIADDSIHKNDFKVLLKENGQDLTKKYKNI